MRLARVEDVRKRMMVPKLGTVEEAIQEILDGVTENLENELRTTFALQRGTEDVFYFEDSKLRGSRFAERLLLSRGLVTQAVTDLKVEVATRFVNLLQGDLTDLRDPSESAVEDKDEFVRVDEKQGLVTIQDFRLFRDYVRVTYDAGIETDRNNADLFMQVAPTLKGSPNLTFADANPDTITRDTGNWGNDGFAVGDVVAVSGSASNNGSFTIASLSSTILTVSASDELVDEGPVGGVSVTATSTPTVPFWLRELAITWAMWELVGNKVLGLEAERSTGDALRPEVLRQKLARLVDEHARIEPAAARPI